MSIYQYFVKVCFHKNENILFILFCHLHFLLKNASWTSFLIKPHRPHSFFFHSCITFCCWIIPVLRILGFKSFKLRLLVFLVTKAICLCKIIFAKSNQNNSEENFLPNIHSVYFILLSYCFNITKTILYDSDESCPIILMAVSCVNYC